MIDVTPFIPHRPPLQLIEKLCKQSPEQVTTSTRIHEAAGFYDPATGLVPAWVGLEYMAQTAAVWIGLRDQAAGKKPEPAFLVSSRQYQAHEPGFPPGLLLYTEVTVKLTDTNIVSFAGKIYDDSGKTWANALFTAFRPDDVAAYLEGESL